MQHSCSCKTTDLDSYGSDIITSALTTLWCTSFTFVFDTN